jgi:hypothetical protein
VLADEAPEAIADKSAVAPAAVAAYESLFYDVRGRLKSPDYILNQVIGPRLRDGTAGWGYDLVWKFFGYVGGASVLDEVMDTCGTGARPAGPREVAAFLSEGARAAVRRHLAVAARALRGGDRNTAGALVRAYTRPAGGEGEGGGTADALAQHIDAMLKEIPWAVGDGAKEKLPPTLAGYDAGAAELRDDELLLLAGGQEPPDLAALKGMQLPPPKPRAEKPGLGDAVHL